MTGDETFQAGEDIPAGELFKKDDIFHGYRVVRLLGCGGLGAVYLVKHEVLDAFYALKILSPSMASQDDMCVKRFLREARLATRVRHPNLVAVHDCGHDEEKGVYYLVMDYVAGNSLRAALGFDGAFSVARAADIIAQVVMALQAAQPFHVVHRDIKPENIMIQPDGLVKLIDLGIAKACDLGDSVQTNTDNIIGTPAYVSPEQAENAACVDERADIYSLGIVFFEMLTGECPFRGRNAAEILSRILSDEAVPDIRDVKAGFPPEVAILIRRMTMKNLNRRINSYDAILTELKRIGCTRVTSVPIRAEIVAKPEVGMQTLLDNVLKKVPAGPVPSPKSFWRKIFGRK